jgi:hypothetical protein
MKNGEKNPLLDSNQPDNSFPSFSLLCYASGHYLKLNKNMNFFLEG